MQRYFRILAILFISCIGALASLAVFFRIRSIMIIRHINLETIDGKILLISILFAVLAALAAFYHSRILHFTSSARSLNTEIIDDPDKKFTPASALAQSNIHWLLWVGNFAFAVAMIRFGIFLYSTIIVTFPIENLPTGYERYLFTLGIILLGVLLVSDEIILLRKYLRKQPTSNS